MTLAVSAVFKDPTAAHGAQIALQKLGYHTALTRQQPGAQLQNARCPGSGHRIYPLGKALAVEPSTDCAVLTALTTQPGQGTVLEIFRQYGGKRLR